MVFGDHGLARGAPLFEGDVAVMKYYTKNALKKLQFLFLEKGNKWGKSGNLFPLFNERQFVKILCQIT
jgi:hypothetical protein